MRNRWYRSGFITLPWILTFTLVSLLLITAASVKLNHRLRGTYQSLFDEQTYYLANSAIERACYAIQTNKVDRELSRKFSDDIQLVKLRVSEDEPIVSIQAESQYSVQMIEKTSELLKNFVNVDQVFLIEGSASIPFRNTTITKSVTKLFFKTEEKEWILIPILAEPIS